jgi:hypothetical protein
MKTKKDNSFWPSYTDLMTSLFFIMLVLYVLTYVRLNSTIKLQKEKLAIIEAVEQNLKPLKQDTILFKYEKKYKRFVLAFDVKFKSGKFLLKHDEIEIDPEGTLKNINLAGKKLLQTIDKLNFERENNSKLSNVSYLVIISGYASIKGRFFDNYDLSYHRALHLWDYWKFNNINFEDPKYEGLIDLQIAGNGLGGTGRIPYTSEFEDEKNQRFIIQIVPKIGNAN